MESIQLAQMLADLSDLDAAQDSRAAKALVTANRRASHPLDATTEKEVTARPAGPSSDGSAGSSILSRTTTPAKFDKLGRRILTPPHTRSNSAYGSIPGTPRRDSDGEEDVDRANTLMALYELRAKLKDQESSRNLSKLREKIAALSARQQMGGERREGDGRAKYIYPKSS
ncbi:hypothetical protein VTJ04DRAFT_1692 [Mycothermus thermophilus]|uniref:uncharacterized protein n=1 Tax=Humicola insolens TaxID=85995 RepID=UPI0037428005